MNLQQLNNKILLRFPNANFEIIEWGEKSNSPLIIKCLDCGVIKTYTRYYGVLAKNKVRFCSNCGETLLQQKTKKRLQEKNFIFIEWLNEKQPNGGNVSKVKFKCPKCGYINTKRLFDFLNCSDECSQCGLGHRILKTNEYFLKEIEEKYQNEYIPLDNYKNAKTKIRVKHSKCNFIFKITPDNLLQGKGCPRCNRYNSIGSKTIEKWLKENNFKYEKEKNFNWIGKKRYDFFVPSVNLLIEFNGIQHYKPIDFFLQNRTFEEQLDSDKEKEKKAIEHGYNFLIIKYDEINRIPEILSSSTTIS